MASRLYARVVIHLKSDVRDSTIELNFTRTLEKLPKSNSSRQTGEQATTSNSSKIDTLLGRELRLTIVLTFPFLKQMNLLVPMWRSLVLTLDGIIPFEDRLLHASFSNVTGRRGGKTGFEMWHTVGFAVS